MVHDSFIKAAHNTIMYMNEYGVYETLQYVNIQLNAKC